MYGSHLVKNYVAQRNKVFKQKHYFLLEGIILICAQLSITMIKSETRMRDEIRITNTTRSLLVRVLLYQYQWSMNGR